MATAAQLRANRANALRSTGPRTVEGKARSSQNRLRHGFEARDPLLPGEDPDLFQALSDQVFDWYRPEGPLQVVLVRRIADILWRLDRAGAADAAIWKAGYQDARAYRAADQVVALEDRHGLDDANEAQRQVQLHLAQAKLDVAKTERLGETTIVGDAAGLSQRSEPGLLLNQRYETGLQRLLERTVRLLEDMQAKKKGDVASPRIEVDLNLGP